MKSKYKKVLTLISLLGSIVGALYFLQLAVMWAWLGATPDFDIARAERNFEWSFAVFILFVLISIYLIYKLLKKR
jgi:hypothetical protein